MTITQAQHTTQTHYISIEQEGPLLIVSVCPLYNNNMCGYPIAKSTYHHTEQDKATRTYKRYIKKYSEV